MLVYFFLIHGFGVSFETEREHCVQAGRDRDLQIIIGAGQNLIEGVVEPPIADFIGRGLSCSHSSHLIQEWTGRLHMLRRHKANDYRQKYRYWGGKSTASLESSTRMDFDRASASSSMRSLPVVR